MVGVRSSAFALLVAAAVRCALGFSVSPRDSGALDPSDLASAFAALNATVGGRLRAAEPLDKPCFSIYEGQQVAADPAECEAIQANYTNPLYRVTHFSAYMQSQWETCQAVEPGGCLLDATNPSNPLAYEGKDCRLGSIPPHYIEVASASDVQAALAFSKKTGVRLSVKNKGHDYKGRSSGKDTLALWTTGLRSISHDAQFQPEGCAGITYDAITTGAGVFTQDVYEFADNVNRTIIGGYHQTIGFSGGYFLGGGHSILSPVYGLAADRVVQVKVVTPDGVFRTANECQNSDLFFALRGGGGSTFGVVIEASHRTEPRFALQASVLKFTASSQADLADWYALAVNHSYRWANEGWGGHITAGSLIHVNPLLSTDEAKASMQPAVDFVLAHGGSAVIEELPSWLAFFTKYVTSAQAAVGAQITLGTRLLPTALFATDEGRAQLASTIAANLDFASPYIVAGTPVLHKAAPGTTSYTPAWRDAIWQFSVSTRFQYNTTLEERKAQYAALNARAQQFRDITPGSGSYFNEGDVYEPDHEQSYWGDNYPRLLEIKQKYDPDGLLDCWQCVGWKGESDPLYQCYIKL